MLAGAEMLARFIERGWIMDFAIWGLIGLAVGMVFFAFNLKGVRDDIVGRGFSCRVRAVIIILVATAFAMFWPAWIVAATIKRNRVSGE